MKFRDALSFVWSKVNLALHNITVEPAFFFLTVAKMMEPAPLNYMLIYKTCRIDFELSEEICNNLEADENEEYEDMVLDEVGFLSMYFIRVYGSLHLP